MIRESTVDNVNYLNYSLPPQVFQKLVPFFELLEQQKDIVHDFSISQTSLEEVFINVSKERKTKEGKKERFEINKQIYK